jgi:hypothetical protein
MSASSEWQRAKDANAVRKQREMADRAAAQVELEINATPETLRQRRVCVVNELMDKGALTAEQRRAAREIYVVWEAINCELRMKVQNYQPQIRGAMFDDWRPSTINAYHDRYVPWRDEAGAQAVKGQGSMTVADLVFKLAVGNCGHRQIADSYKMDQRTVLNLIRVSLLRYAEIGGWVDVCGRSRLYA